MHSIGLSETLGAIFVRHTKNPWLTTLKMRSKFCLIMTTRSGKMKQNTNTMKI